MTYDRDGHPRIEPARWMWRGQEIRVDPWEMALRQAPAQGTDGTVRIGDAERDAAVSALGDHYAAGRLTREEFDERSDQAMQARFHGDLQPLFADLPRAPRARWSSSRANEARTRCSCHCSGWRRSCS